MALSLPFQPKADIDLQSDASAFPGAALPVRIRLTPREEIKPREVRLELVGRETYYVRQHSGGKNGGTRIVRRNSDFNLITRTLAQQPVLTRGIEQYWDTALALPPEAPPTSRGKLVDVRWALKSVIDIPMRPDHSSEVPVLVYKLPPQSEASAPAPAGKAFDECLLKMEAPHVAAAGDTLIGHLHLEMRKEINVRGIRVELISYEDAGARKESAVAASRQVAESLAIGPHEMRSFEFALSIPVDSPPSMVSPHSSLRWVLKVSLDRRFRGDFNIEQEVLVYNAPEGKS